MDFRDIETRLQRLERLLAGLPAEANALWDDLQAVKKYVIQREAALVALGREASQLREDVSHLGAELGATQRRTMGAAGQLVAITRLQSTLDRGAMFQALEEVVASLLGCEELALFERIGTPATLRLACAVGISAERLAAMRLDEGIVGRSAAAGGMWLAEHRGACDRSEPRLTAVLPLEVDGQGVGALVLFRLLEHKAHLDAADVELLDLLRLHLGVALVATRGNKQEPLFS